MHDLSQEGTGGFVEWLQWHRLAACDSRIHITDRKSVPPFLRGISLRRAQKNAGEGDLPAIFAALLARHGRCAARFCRPSANAAQAMSPCWKVEATMKKINGLMKLGAAFAGLALAATMLVTSVPARATDDFDAAGTYKAKCFACHGAKAEKKFDAALSDADMVQAVLKGKKPEKPPNMPAFEERGITADQATALVAYMTSIK